MNTHTSDDKKMEYKFQNLWVVYQLCYNRKLKLKKKTFR